LKLVAATAAAFCNKTDLKAHEREGYETVAPFFHSGIARSNATLPMTDRQDNPLPSLAPMLETVNPAVVNISTYSKARYDNNPLMNDPFFRYFFDLPNPRQQSQRRQQSAGSGVIVDAEEG
jgi:serine protease Do/serine protease DegQ